MPSDADIRSVLREHGIEVTKRGKLGDKHYAAYEKIRARGQQQAADEPESWDGPDDDGDITRATLPPDAAPADTGDQDDDTTPQDQPQERRPRKVRKTGPSITDRLRGAKPEAGAGKRKTALPRISTARLISRVWSATGRIVAPVSGSVSRTLQLQAPVAGLILDDTVKDTFVDPALQIAARAQERGEKIFGLAGPPLIVAAIEQAQGLEEPQRSLRLAVLVPMLEEALTIWVKIAGDKMATAAAEVEADEAMRAEVQRLIMLIFPQATVEEQAPDMAGAPA